MRRRTLTALAAVLATVGATAFAASPATAAPAAPSVTGPMTHALATQLAKDVDKHVIVILKNQLAPQHVGSAAAKTRASKIAASQAPVVSELKQVRSTHIATFGVTNSLSATVSDGEETRLKADPAVAEVIPDVTIHLADPAQSLAKAAASTTSSLPLNNIPGACGANGAVQLDPEGLALMHVDSDSPHAQTARSLGFTGSGVKVAYIADGIDPNNVNFLRADGTSAVVDSQDFSGDGPGVTTSGDEAFLDANSIIGQGRHVYDVSHFSAQPTPAACNVRIEGVAPGASLVALNVFGTNEDTTESNFLQAIDYAVQTDHVNVLNESFGSNPFPDVTSLDATKQFNDAAVAAGVTVTVSSGDAGSTNTIGSPATDPNVIAVGGSTDLRFYAQTDYADARYFAKNGWLDNNISSLSSGGVNETGGTVSLVAPGELSFASCDASAEFTGCTNFLGQPSDVEESGGTSESAPLTAGAAALVIQAYEKTHGAAPTPAEVKQLLVSTASDLGAPATEQGAGLVNAYRAVLAAMSVNSGGRAPRVLGATLLKSAGSLQATAVPGTRESWPVTVTNESSDPQVVQVSGRTLGQDRNVQTGKVTLSDATSPTVVGFNGLTNDYAKFTFTVPRGQSRLDASLAYPGDPLKGLNARVRMDLIDPKGRLAAHSLPQGVGNFGNSDVVDPTPGTWTGYIFGDQVKDGGTNGTVVWRTATETYVPFAHVSQPVLVLAPGKSRTLTVSTSTPATPGDASGSIVFRSNLGFAGTSTIPVTLRSTIDPSRGGRFAGTLTGGNGRDPGQGQEQFYRFTVGRGVHDITADVNLTNDAGDPVGTYLVAPDGDALGYGQNSADGTATLSASAWTVDPAPGNWTLVVDFAEPVVGNEISQPYTGSVVFNGSKVSAKGLPTTSYAKLAAGQAVTVPVTVTNNGAAPEDFFVDGRLNGTTTETLTGLTQTSGLKLPLTGSPAEWFVPTESSSISIGATGSLPTMFDAGIFSGDPDLSSTPPTGGPLCSTSPTLTYAPSGGALPSGGWFAEPSECGPYSGPAPAGTASVTATVQTKPIDPAVSSPTGDAEVWATDPSVDVKTVTIDPGKSAVIPVTITPTGASGTVVTGTLYVDNYVSDVPPYGQFATDEVAAVPYAYTIK